MNFDRPRWKDDWDEAREHYRQWWKREGPVLTFSGLRPLDEPRDNVPSPPKPKDPREYHTDPDWFAFNQRHSLATQRFPADNLPIAHTDYGCVQLAACFGAEPEFDDHTVWYSESISDPDDCPALVLTKEEPWWQAYKRIMLQAQEISRLAGTKDNIEGVMAMFEKRTPHFTGDVGDKTFCVEGFNLGYAAAALHESVPQCINGESQGAYTPQTRDHYPAPVSHDELLCD